jgi:CRP-like cAMP-binding protein
VAIDREEDALVQTSSGIALQHVAAGEKVIRQGQVSQALYIIVAVLALMFSRDFKGREQEVLSLGNGEFFDEMCLFSGEPSLVTVIASNDLEVMRISAAMVHQMIDRQPSFAREIGQILEIRRAAIQETSQPPRP